MCEKGISRRKIGMPKTSYTEGSPFCFRTTKIMLGRERHLTKIGEKGKKIRVIRTIRLKFVLKITLSSPQFFLQSLF
jgi:hypothetical protein